LSNESHTRSNANLEAFGDCDRLKIYIFISSPKPAVTERTNLAHDRPVHLAVSYLNSSNSRGPTGDILDQIVFSANTVNKLRTIIGPHIPLLSYISELYIHVTIFVGPVSGVYIEFGQEFIFSDTWLIGFSAKINPVTEFSVLF
jgi:hypothetical protein